MSTPWRKSPPELVERFETAVAGIEGLEQRQMFGYPASFIGGNLTSSLHQDRTLDIVATVPRGKWLEPLQPVAQATRQSCGVVVTRKAA